MISVESKYETVPRFVQRVLNHFSTTKDEVYRQTIESARSTSFFAEEVKAHCNQLGMRVDIQSKPCMKQKDHLYIEAYIYITLHNPDAKEDKIIY